VSCVVMKRAAGERDGKDQSCSEALERKGQGGLLSNLVCSLLASSHCLRVTPMSTAHPWLCVESLHLHPCHPRFVSAGCLLLFLFHSYLGRAPANTRTPRLLSMSIQSKVVPGTSQFIKPGSARYYFLSDTDHSPIVSLLRSPSKPFRVTPPPKRSAPLKTFATFSGPHRIANLP
jgi:hypothetical protein